VGALFWVATTVVVLGILQTYGYVRRQFVVSLLGAAFAGAGAATALSLGAPLWMVAASASAGTAISWMIGVAVTHRVVPDSRPASAVRFVVVTGIQCVALGVALAITSQWIARTLVYAIIAAVPTINAVKEARRHWLA
jgi:hypothetical protein